MPRRRAARALLAGAHYAVDQVRQFERRRRRAWWNLRLGAEFESLPKWVSVTLALHVMGVAALAELAIWVERLVERRGAARYAAAEIAAALLLWVARTAFTATAASAGLFARWRRWRPA